MNRITKPIHHLKDVFSDTISTSLILFKIMIPVSIIVKILEYTGLITQIGDILSPFMQLIGLPGETGLVWATAMITNIYGGIIVFITLASEQIFTVAQATILGSMILIAHSLPVEVTIARKAGIRVWFTILFRILSACLFGFILHTIFSFFQLFNTPSSMAWTKAPQNATILDWIINNIVYDDDMAAISVNYPTGVILSGSYIVNATVQNMGFYPQTDVVVNCSIF